MSTPPGGNLRHKWTNVSPQMKTWCGKLSCRMAIKWLHVPGYHDNRETDQYMCMYVSTQTKTLCRKLWDIRLSVKLQYTLEDGNLLTMITAEMGKKFET